MITIDLGKTLGTAVLLTAICVTALGGMGLRVLELEKQIKELKEENKKLKKDSSDLDEILDLAGL